MCENGDILNIIRRPRTELGLFALASAALVALLFRDALLHGYVLGQADFLFRYLPWSAHRPLGWRIRNPLMGDVPMQFYPWMLHAKSAVLAGHFPLWNSAAGAGQPFFAAFQTALLSPFSLIAYILPFPAGLTAVAAARLMVGGVGMYLLLRKLELSAAAAAFGGIAYLLNPFSIVWLEHPHSAVAAWLPWLLLASELCVVRANRRAVGLTALVVMAAILSGHPETLLKIALLMAAYTIYRGAATGQLLRSVVLVALGSALGILLASIQLLPFLEYARASRALALRAASVDLLAPNPPASFVTTFVPDFYGTPIGRGYVLGGTNYCEQQIYPGIVTWAFVAVAFLHRRLRGLAAFFVLTAALAAAVVYGTVVARIAVTIIPPLRITLLSRFGVIVIAALAITAAVGLDALLTEVRERSTWRAFRPAIVVAAGAGAIALVIAMFWTSQHQLLADSRQAIHTSRCIVWTAELLAEAIVLTCAAPALPRRVTAAAALLLLSADLVAFADGFHAQIPRQLAFQELPDIAAARADRDRFRVAGWMDTLLPNTAMAYGLQDFRGYDALGVREYSELLDAGFTFTGSTHQLVNTAALPLIDLLGIKYVFAPPDVDFPRDHFERIADGPTVTYRNVGAQPRAFLADAAVVLRGPAALRAIRAGSVDLHRQAIVDAPLEPSSAPETAAPAIGEAWIRRYEDERVVVDTNAGGRRLLVLTDAFYPGWSATVDGASAPITRVDYAFRGIALAAGHHVVEFRYRPASLRLGFLLSLAGLPLLVWTSRGHR